MSIGISVQPNDPGEIIPVVRELPSSVTLSLDAEGDRVTFFFNNLDQVLALSRKINATAVKLIKIGEKK
jgi:hypothetical protein